MPEPFDPEQLKKLAALSISMAALPPGTQAIVRHIQDQDDYYWRAEAIAGESPTLRKLLEHLREYYQGDQQRIYHELLSGRWLLEGGSSGG